MCAAGEVLTGLAAMGKRVVFVTNNSTKSRVQYAKKFAELGLAVPPEMIYPSVSEQPCCGCRCAALTARPRSPTAPPSTCASGCRT